MRTFERSSAARASSAAFVEGDAFHRYDRAEMKGRMAEELARGNQHFSHFGPETNLFEELEALFRDYGESGRGRTRKYLHNDRGGRALRAARRAPSRPGRICRADTDLLFYEGLHGAVVTDKVERRAVRRPADRRRAGRQPGVDPEAAPRPRCARLLDRGGHRHHPAAHAGLRATTSCPQFGADARQLPARPGRRHLEPVHRAPHPGARTRASS